MKPRTVFSACVAGFIAALLLKPLFLSFLPGLIIPELIHKELPLPVVLLACFSAGCAIFCGGYFSARLEWSQNWGEAAQSGFFSGLVAGCLAYLFSGATAASALLGGLQILQNLSRPITSKMIGASLILNSTIDLAIWVPVIFWIILLSSCALGIAGGLCSRLRHTPPAHLTQPQIKNPGMERVAAYTLGLYLLLIMSIAVAMLKPISNSINKSPFYSDVPQIEFIPIYTSGIFLFVCMVLIAGWIQPFLEDKAEHFKVSVGIGMSIFTIIPLYLTLPSFAVAVALIFAIMVLTAFFIRKFRKHQPDIASGRTLYSWKDLLASGLAQGVLCGTLTIVLIEAYFISLMYITIPAIPYLTLEEPPKLIAQVQIETILGFNS